MTLRPKDGLLNKVKYLLSTPIYIGNAPKSLNDYIELLKKDRSVQSVETYSTKPISQVEVLLKKPLTSKEDFIDYLMMKRIPVNEDDIKWYNNGVGIINTDKLHVQFYKKE